MYIYSSNPHSEGAKSLANVTGIKRIKHQNSKFKGGLNKTVINWGASVCPPEVLKCQVINHPAVISVVINKLAFFQNIAEARIPEWTTDPNVVASWINDGRMAVARTILNGHSGQGIVLIENKDQIVDAPLYTMYVPKKDEYRIHIFNGETIDFQRKAKKQDFEGEVNWKVRNLANGFVYVRGDVNPPQDVFDQAVAAIKETGLMFGAVDVIWNDNQEKAYVLEINTAPGLTGTTLEKYVDAVRRLA